MRHLFDEWEPMLASKARAHLVLFLDFDGTLAPLAPTPDEAALPPATRAVMERLVSSPRCTVVVVSGRSLDDVRAKIGVDGVVYVGSHGLEAAGSASLPSYEPPQPVRELLSWMRRELERRLSAVPGVLFEEKKAALAVHYRRTGPRDAGRVEQTVREAVSVLDVGGLLDVAPGKMVLELRPRLEWNKGTAVEWLVRAEERRRAGVVFPVYVGDDITDEDGFRALAGRGLAVLVGDRRESAASHYLANTEEVTRMLQVLAGRWGEPLDR